MKTRQINSFKSLTAMLVAIAFFGMTSCIDQAKKPTIDKEEATKEIKVNPPSVDIHTAVFMGNVDAVRQHIEAGSDLNAKDQYGSTPLIIAATFNKPDVAILLIDAGADMNISGNDGSTALHTSAFFCRTEIVKALLANGADKTLTNNYGSTALASVSYPFSEAKGIYDQISKDLGPLGFKLDYEYLEVTRPKIAKMLQ